MLLFCVDLLGNLLVHNAKKYPIFMVLFFQRSQSYVHLDQLWFSLHH